MDYILIFLYIIIIISFFSFLSLAPWLPTKKNDLERINKIISLKENEKFLEIWAWTSRVSIYLAKNNPKSNIMAIELSLLFYLISKIKIYFSWLKNIKISYWNALNLDLWSFDVLYIFWLPDTITKKIFPRIKHIKNKNFRLISYCFIMKNNLFIETKYKETNDLNSIYKYSLS